jgi:NADH:ubiquinone reductase (H+-translocating)
VTEPRPTRIVVIGGGYAGSHAAVAARRAGGDVTVVDQDGLHGFLPRLAGVAAGRLRAGDARTPLGELLGVQVHQGRAERLDVSKRVVELVDESTVAYDGLVVTVGSRTAGSPVPGADEHAWSLHTPDDALALRVALRTASQLVVVGGGATGVQLAAEVASANPGLPVRLVEASARLLPAEPRVLGSSMRRLLDDAGVELHLGVPVAAIDGQGAELADGQRLDGLVVWAGGWEADANALFPGAETADGRVVVERDLTVPGYDRVLAAGDIAAHQDLIGRPLAMSAQIAVQAGAAAGASAVALAHGERPKWARLFELGRVVDLGHRGVGRIGPIPLGWGPTARLVPLMHLAIDLRHLAQLGGPLAALAHAPGRGGHLDIGGHREPLRAVS